MLAISACQISVSNICANLQTRSVLSFKPYIYKPTDKTLKKASDKNVKQSVNNYNSCQHIKQGEFLQD